MRQLLLKLHKLKKHYLYALSTSEKVTIISFEIITGLFLSILSFRIFSYLAESVLKKSFYKLDYNLIIWAISIRTPLLNKIMFFFTNLGGPVFLTLITLLVSFLLIKKHKKETVLFLIAITMGVVLNLSLKLMFDRQRPQIFPLAIENTQSFPSGHAMNNFIFYSLLVYLTYHLSKNKKLTLLTGIFSIIMIILIGFSRIYLGVHYFTDILAGYVAGFCWLLTILSVAYTMVLFDLFMPKPTLKERILIFLKKILQFFWGR